MLVLLATVDVPLEGRSILPDIARMLVSDNGPEFVRYDVSRLLNDWGTTHKNIKPSSPTGQWQGAGLSAAFHAHYAAFLGGFYGNSATDRCAVAAAIHRSLVPYDMAALNLDFAALSAVMVHV